MNHTLNLENLISYTDKSFFLIAGPCVVENEAICFQVAEEMQKICSELGVFYIFKSSYRKANRSSAQSFSGLGDRTALNILEKVKNSFNIPICTDIHTAIEAVGAAEVADVLQIPAFLCRQTDILEAAASTGKVVNIKKGQFLSPESMKFAAEKVVLAGNKNVLLTDRGTMFGYGDLIVDFRSIPKMQAFGFPVVMDCTHSLQQPNQASGITGGQPQMIETIARAAIATGADGLFIETHPSPQAALSDGANMLPLNQMKSLLKRLVAIKETVSKF